MLRWEYEGVEKDEEDAINNLQLAQPGCTMKHDTFGLCTHLDNGEGVADGSFKVKLHSDGSVKELTKGQFQYVHAAPKIDNVENPQDDQNNNDKPVGNTEQAVNNLAGRNEEPSQPTNDGSNNGGGANENEQPAKNDTVNNDPSNDEKTSTTPGQPPPPPNDEPGGENDNPPGDDSPIFKQVVEEMAKQHSKYGLEPEELGLLWYKSLVRLLFIAISVDVEHDVYRYSRNIW
eukprot:6187575-Pleurochrysis_carterae.AAC.1